MGDDPATSGRSGSWWATLPGMLTAAAGLITAITAMVVALNGVFGNSPDMQSAPSVSPNLGTVDATGTTPAAGSSAPAEPEQAAYDVRFPGGARATDGDVVYQVRSATVEPRNPGELTLALTVRATNNGRYDLNFWDRTFRLGVGDGRRAPVGGLDELVAGDSSKDGVVEFVVPDAPGALTLFVKGSEKRVELPIRLRRQ